jgi:protein-L-isoaspartate(D-aspartate) O-methyltransferase
MPGADCTQPGWIVPPPREPTKSRADLARERAAKVEWLVRHGYLRSERIRLAMLTVPREAFIPPGYRDYAYFEVPLPLPGERATISCPHSYPLFYEALGLDREHRFMEIGLGSGYGTALAREIVGPDRPPVRGRRSASPAAAGAVGVRQTQRRAGASTSRGARRASAR